MKQGMPPNLNVWTIHMYVHISAPIKLNTLYKQTVGADYKQRMNFMMISKAYSLSKII